MTCSLARLQLNGQRVHHNKRLILVDSQDNAPFEALEEKIQVEGMVSEFTYYLSACSSHCGSVHKSIDL